MLILFATNANAAPPQVTIYMGGYGAGPQQAPAPQYPVQLGQSGVSGAGGVTPGEAALAQLAAYQQYLL